MERELQRDKEAFEAVVEHFLSLEHEPVSIWRRGKLEAWSHLVRYHSIL